MKGYKIFTYDWRSPLRGGRSWLKGTPTFPMTLPVVELDTSDAECGAGWNFSLCLADAAAIAGWWPMGRPAQIVTVEAEGAIILKRKCRAATLTLLGLVSPDEIQGSMRTLVEPWAGDHAEALTREQWAWYLALGRPEHDPGRVEDGLRLALATRGLSWSLLGIRNEGLVVRAWQAKQRSMDAMNAWNAWVAWDARNAWKARISRNARDACDACDAWNARNAWDAWNALTVQSAVRCFGLATIAADHLTLGLRDAYRAGLGLALPIGPQQLGWTMMEGT